MKNVVEIATTPVPQSHLGDLFRELGHIMDLHEDRFHRSRRYDETVKYEMQALLHLMGAKGLVPEFAKAYVDVKMDEEYRACYFTLFNQFVPTHTFLAAMMLDQGAFYALRAKMQIK